MKYGVIVVTPIENKGSRPFINIGDMVQTVAVLDIYKRMGIPDCDIVRVELNSIDKYDGEQVILPININLSLNWIIDVFPLPSNITPVFIGLSYFAATDLPQSVADYFKKYSPIGCRDEATYNLMRKNGIDAYLAGCVTFTINNSPESYDEREKDTVYLVDVDDTVEKLLPGNIIEGRRIEKGTHIYRGDDCYDISKMEHMTRELLHNYSKAALVVTSRLHCMSPCLAMGTPTVPIMSNISPRMGWIDRFSPIYTYWKKDEIDFSGVVFKNDGIKEKMEEVIVSRLRGEYVEPQKLQYLTDYFQNRQRCLYGNYYQMKLEEVSDRFKNGDDYFIWGAGQIGMNSTDVIENMYPDSRLVAVIDTYAAGDFKGIQIEKPTDIEKYKGIYCLITTYSGSSYAREYLERMGFAEGKDYYDISSVNG